MTFELLLITMIGLSLQLEGKAASTHQLAQQSYTCTEAELEDLAERWRESYLPAAGALRACGSSAVPGLIDVMTDKTVDSNIRQLSARLLAQIGSEEAVIALLDAASDEALQTSIYQAFRVFNRDSLSVVPLLKSALGSEELSRATAAAKGLARLASADAIDALLEALRVDATQEAAFVGLGEISSNSPAAVDVLIASLKDESEIIQVGAAYGLAEIGLNAEAAISELANLLYVSESEYLHPEEGSEARGMAAYALGKINPLHEEALKALVITASLQESEIIETTKYYPEPKEEVRTIAAEALDEIDDVLHLLNWSYEGDWRWLALGYQSSLELLEILDKLLVDTDTDPDILLRATDAVLRFHPDTFMALIEQDNSFSNLSNRLLVIIEDKNIDARTKYFAAYMLSILFIDQPSLYKVDESFVLRLVSVIKDEEEDIYIRRGALFILYGLLYGINYDSSPEAESVVEALIRIAKDSQLYELWGEDYEQLESQEIIDWDDIGASAMAVLLEINDWSFCSNRSSRWDLYVERQASPSSVFLSQLEQENPTFFQALCQNAQFSDEIFLLFSINGAESSALVVSVSQHQRNNQPAICRYGIAQRLVPRCR